MADLAERMTPQMRFIEQNIWSLSVSAWAAAIAGLGAWLVVRRLTRGGAW